MRIGVMRAGGVALSAPESYEDLREFSILMMNTPIPCRPARPTRSAGVGPGKTHSTGGA